jgi:LSD1 subclass zinc finger protein
VTRPWPPSLRHLWLASSLLSVSCADSTGPNPHSATSVAEYIDALYKEGVVIANNNPLYDTRPLFLTQAEYAPAFGAPPTAVTVATATGDQLWKVVAYEIFDPADPKPARQCTSGRRPLDYPPGGTSAKGSLTRRSKRGLPCSDAKLGSIRSHALER